MPEWSGSWGKDDCDCDCDCDCDYDCGYLLCCTVLYCTTVLVATAIALFRVRGQTGRRGGEHGEASAWPVVAAFSFGETAGGRNLEGKEPSHNNITNYRQYSYIVYGHCKTQQQPRHRKLAALPKAVVL